MDLATFIEKISLLGAVTYDTPFDQDTLVFRIGGKIFLLTNIAQWDANCPKINIKALPEEVTNYIETYSFVTPGYHMNKKHWITVDLAQAQPTTQITTWIQNSYELVYNSLSKKIKADLENK